ncbi:SDR family oxidoreductase [Kribbella sp. NPDC050124]|uniref:SDR family oxidoreductase n=1 Tax=Kribbella sp. NPDC050124 TaxID=3364114 RepID=UPI0037B0B1E8
MQGRILVVGATGLVGAAATEHFAARPGWEVVTLSRRPPTGWTGAHLQVDLTDRDACAAAFRHGPPITHVLYAALQEEEDLEAGWRSDQQQQTNLAMLRHVLDGVERHGALEHVTVLQGGKAYGSHLGRVPVPAKERWPRMSHRIFYWQQEDLLRERAAAGRWSFNILRPQLILGRATSSPMNVISAIGVYAAVLREIGRPLDFPGGGIYVTACSDSRLIAQAVEFCATTDAAAGETYNVVNGDAIVWRDLWPSIAAHFDMPAGAHVPMRLAEEMPRQAAVWDDIVAKHDLQQRTMHDVVGSSWQTADLTFGFGKERPFDRLMSPVKLRQAGFPGCMDTEDAVLYWLRRLQAERVIPTY